MSGPVRSLVIAPQWIGDAVMCEPLLAALAARGERLTVAALPSVAPVFRAMPEVADIVELPFAHGRLDWPARRRLASQWRGRFEAAYVLPNSIKSALVPWLARVPRRVGYTGESRAVLLNERLRNPVGRPPMVAFYGALAGAAFDASATPALRIDAAARDAALQQAGLETGRFWAFAPGAEYGPAKRWPEAHYASLAATLHARDGSRVALLGSPAERPLCEAVSAASPGACVVLAGALSLFESIALVSASRGMVSNDSGLMHVAAAFGVPQVAVFGSTSPLHTPPSSARAQVVWLEDELGLDCMPCYARTCRYGHYRCLADVSPARVDAALADASRSPPTA